MTKILVVDDDPNVRFTVRIALESAPLEGADMDVHEAVDGPAALAALNVGGFDVVLLDVMMPGQDGLSVLQAIRRSVHRDLAVIMLTAKGRESDVAAAFRSGADAYMTKPFEVDELAELTYRMATAPRSERRAVREQEMHRAELLLQLEQSFGDLPLDD